MNPLWERVIAAMDADVPLSPTREVPVELESPISAERALAIAIEGLRDGMIHPTHPRYFGLFNPTPLDISVMADALVAAFNPQLATHSHAQWAVDVERTLIATIGAKFGAFVDGTFTTGGAEANTTALLCALHARYPSYGTRGARDINPTIYVSGEAHPTMARAARMCGLGSDAVRVIPTDNKHRMKTKALAESLEAEPLMIVATVGTTSAGTIDPLNEVASIAERCGAWFHVDAAWGGFAAIVPELQVHVRGIERSDSITFDAHKALFVPMAGGMFFTRHGEILHKTFGDHAGYMPRDHSLDPYAHSMQWSRRFIGLKVYLALATLGFEGYIELWRKQVSLGELLRTRLRDDGFTIVNDTPLPVVCFRGSSGDLGAIAKNVKDAWISVIKLATGERALRACVINHRTTESDVHALCDALRAAAR
jgi:glutamate/tyrosine decarboxylase-like PLP-dependent enzyme